MKYEEVWNAVLIGEGEGGKQFVVLQGGNLADFIHYLGERLSCDNLLMHGDVATEECPILQERFNVFSVQQPLPRETLKNSILLSFKANVRNGKISDSELLKGLMEDAPAGLFITDIFPQDEAEKACLSWTNQLHSAGFHIDFSGVVGLSEPYGLGCLAVLGPAYKKIKPVPQDFKVAAIMTAYNEEDIIEQSIKRLMEQDVFVYVIDNWSNDATFSILQKLEGEAHFLGVERYPQSGPAPYYLWRELLGRVEELSKSIDAQWIIHHDVDEIRESPWSNLNLKEGIHHVDQRGFNAIDHTVIIFRPVDDKFVSDKSLEESFRFFEFGKSLGSFLQIKAWKKTGYPVNLAQSGGHNALFAGRKVFPYKFLLKHYPLRNQRQAEKKVLLERKPRWNPEERAIGWHTHYDHFQHGASIIRAPAELEAFDEQCFYSRFLLERLSGVGINRS